MITKEFFDETAVALKEPTGKVFESASTYIDMALQQLTGYVSALADIDEQLLEHMQRAACLKGAYDVVPLLDLVATPNGFGIVSNQNIAPASPHRVQALRQELLLQYTLRRDCMLAYMQQNAVQFAPAHAPRCLCWAPFILSSRGVSVTTGRPLNVDEYRELQPIIAEGEAAVADIMGAALYRRLVTAEAEGMQWVTDDEHRHLVQIRDAALYYIVNLIHSRRNPQPPRRKVLQSAERMLQDALNNAADVLPEYKESRQYLALHTPRYQNTKGDPCFFS